MSRSLANSPQNNPLTPLQPPPQTATSIATIHLLKELIARSDSKSALLKNLAKLNKPVLVLIVGMIQNGAYENSRDHLLTLLDEMSKNERIIQALDGISDA